MTIKTLVPQSNNRFHICGMQLVASILQIGRMAVKVLEAGEVSKLLLLQHDGSRMALLGLVVDLADLTCHIDIIGGRPLLVGFDSGL